MNTKKNSQSIAILGGGFLSKNISLYFKKKHSHVYLIDRKICDLLDVKKLSILFQTIPPLTTFIIPAAVTRLVSNDKDSYDKNINLIKNLLKVMPINVKHVIFFSTVDVYGVNPELPISELSPVNPNDFYAKAKLDSENILKKESELKGFNLTILRLCGVYGKGDNKIIGILNIATGQSQTISFIAKKIVSILTFKVDINIKNKIIDDRVLKLQFDISSLSNEFKEFKMTSLDDGLVYYINNYLSYEVKK